MEYEVTIREICEKVVTIEADSKLDAEEIAEERWNNCDYIIDADDFVCASFEAEPKGLEYERRKRNDTARQI